VISLFLHCIFIFSIILFASCYIIHIHITYHMYIYIIYICMYIYHRYTYMGVSINGGSPKWMVYNGKYHERFWFRGTPILGNIHIYTISIPHSDPTLKFQLPQGLWASQGLRQRIQPEVGRFKKPPWDHNRKTCENHGKNVEFMGMKWIEHQKWGFFSHP